MTCTSCVIVTCDGPSVAIVDDLLLTKPTRRIEEDRLAEILAELRAAAAQDRVRR